MAIEDAWGAVARFEKRAFALLANGIVGQRISAGVFAPTCFSSKASPTIEPVDARFA
jgi:uncharacterized protein YbjQ (UPF0145 family)